MRVVNISNECGLRFTATTITDGKEVNRVGGDYSVPKMNLVGAFEMPFHQGTMHVAEGFGLWGRPPRRAARFRARPGHAGISRHLLASGYAASTIAGATINRAEGHVLNSPSAALDMWPSRVDHPTCVA